jgi:hypothetical protein
MIRQRIVLPRYGGWKIQAYYAVSTYYIDEIMEQLWDIGIDAKNAKDAWENLSDEKLNTGLCYSNYSKRKTVIVVALTSSAAEALNSITHEIAHCCVHISSAFNIDYRSEEFAYLVGDVSMAAYPAVKDLLCDCCRNKKDYEH